MKKILLTLTTASVVFLSGCTVAPLTPEQNLVRSISSTEGCELITSDYLESRPQALQHYLKRNTDHSGGNAYKLVSSDSTVVMGTNVVMANYEVYKCQF